MAGAGAAPAVAVKGLRVTYGGASEPALEDVTLSIQPGEFVGLVGPNGAGKTTLLNAILGLVPASAGSVSLYGEPVARFRSWPRLGYVPQNASQVEARFPATALEVALLGRVARRGPFRWLTRADREKARRAMEEVGVADLAARLIGSLSGGQCQRVLLAKALSGDPDLLILDEPTTGVDPEHRASFYELLDHLNHDHDLTILIVSHDTDAIARSAHRVVAVNKRIVFDGPPERFLEEQARFAHHIDLHHQREGSRPDGFGGH